MRQVLLAAAILATCRGFQFPGDDDGNEPASQVGHLDLDVQNKMQAGAEAYDMLKSQVPMYGVCWLNALHALHVGCKQLDDNAQARLGLAFANCFLEKIGGVTFPCPPAQDIRKCASGMDDRAFQAYTQFFTHTQTICFFLANQLWQTRTEQTISKLSSTSHEVAHRLERLQSLQKQSIDTQSRLNQELSGSRAALQDFEQTLRDKHSIEREILMRFLEMRDFILSEVSKFYAIGFYFGSLMFFYLMTTPERTKEARIWIFLIYAFNLVVERVIVSHVLWDQASFLKEMWMVSNNIDDHIWICRKSSLAIAVIVLLYFASSYKDYAILNNILLNDIKRQNDEIKRLHEISLTRKSDHMDFSAMMQSCFSSDESSDDSSNQICESEVPDPTMSTVLPDIIATTEQTAQVKPQLNVIVAAESSHRRYELRTRSSQASPVGSPAKKRTGSNQTLASTDSRYNRSVFSSDEDS